MYRYVRASWSSFDKYGPIIDKYMPSRGEGDTLASQAVTAVNKIIYKWFNDGDVYDNQYSMKGWENDLSSYANWLYEHVQSTKAVLDEISECHDDKDYEELLDDLAYVVFNEDLLERLETSNKQDSIYNCKGPFEWSKSNINYDDDGYYKAWESDEDEEY